MTFLDTGLHGILVQRLREINSDDGACRAHRLTLTAKLALGEINVGDVVLNGDGIVSTSLRADSAADAAGRASLLHSWPLVLVHAGHVHPHSARSLGPQLDDGFRASFTQAPQAVHFSWSTTGRPVSGFMDKAPN